MSKKNPGPAVDLEKACAGELLDWFSRNARDLPWRRNRTAYRVWLSELMLQQTRVDQVIPYYRRFLKRFPSLTALASAPVDDVLKQWEGMGYYSRARNLHKTARLLVGEHHGRFPRTCKDLQKLPGIGPYTAAAIASLAFNEDAAVVDGNVIRVLTRLMADGRPVNTAESKKRLQAWAEQLLPSGKAGAFNEAMMELGATVCSPTNPDCPRCPLRGVCRGLAGGRPVQFPVKPPRKRVPHKVVGAAVVQDSRGRLLIAQRRPEAMLGGLWEFPGGTLEKGETIEQCVVRELHEELGLHIRLGEKLTVVKHAYSHFTIELHTFMARIQTGRPRALHCADFRWVWNEELDRFAFSKADLEIIRALRKAP